MTPKSDVTRVMVKGNDAAGWEILCCMDRNVGIPRKFVKKLFPNGAEAIEFAFHNRADVVGVIMV